MREKLKNTLDAKTQHFFLPSMELVQKAVAPGRSAHRTPQLLGLFHG